METQTTNQRQCDHGRWPEANVGQQYQKGPDRLVHQILTVPTTINPEKRPAVGSQPRIRMTYTSWHYIFSSDLTQCQTNTKVGRTWPHMIQYL